MKLYFVRHGETDFNLHHVLMGNTGDANLDQHGINQAHDLAEKIAAMPFKFDILFCSPLSRAQETADIIAQKINLKIHIRKELGERDYGKLEGETYAEIKRETGYDFPYIEQHLNLDLKKFQVEPGSAVHLRLAKFLSEVKTNFSDKKVLSVAHKGVITALYEFYPQTRPQDIGNASIHEFEI